MYTNSYVRSNIARAPTKKKLCVYILKITIFVLFYKYNFTRIRGRGFSTECFFTVGQGEKEGLTYQILRNFIFILLNSFIVKPNIYFEKNLKPNLTHAQLFGAWYKYFDFIKISCTRV